MTPPFDVVKEAVKGPLIHGHTTVGTSIVQLTTINDSVFKGVLLRCPGSSDPVPNGSPIWVGNIFVTADSTADSGGLPIAPGEALFIPIDDPSNLYVRSTAAGQDIAWMLI